METTAKRGRPRSDEATAGMLDTALGLLLERGYDRFSVEEVAARAGVAKTTLYRRWATKDHLIVALVARVQDEVPVVYSGDVQADLEGYLRQIVQGLEMMRRAGRPEGAGDTSAGLVAEVAAAAARHADIGDLVRGMFARRNKHVLTLLEQARSDGELHSGVEPETVFDQLAGALYYRLLVTGQPIDDLYVDRLVDSVLRGARA